MQTNARCEASVARLDFAHPAVADQVAVLPLEVCAGLAARGTVLRVVDGVPAEVDGRGRQGKAREKKSGSDFPHDAILSKKLRNVAAKGRTLGARAHGSVSLCVLTATRAI